MPDPIQPRCDEDLPVAGSPDARPDVALRLSGPVPVQRVHDLPIRFLRSLERRLGRKWVRGTLDGCRTVVRYCEKGANSGGGDDGIGESGWTHRLKDSWLTHFGAGISRPRHSVACSGLLDGASAGSCDRLPTTGVLREAKRLPASVILLCGRRAYVAQLSARWRSVPLTAPAIVRL